MSRTQVSQGTPIVAGFFEKHTSSVQYIVADPETKECAIIDPVLDFDPNSGATATHSADELLEHIKQENYHLRWIAGWLKRTHPEEEGNQVSHETIYRSLFVQARGVLKPSKGGRIIGSVSSPTSRRQVGGKRGSPHD